MTNLRGPMPHLTYDAEADALGVQLMPDAVAARSTKVAPGVRLDFDAADRPIFLEVLGASGHYPRLLLEQLGTPAIEMTLREAAAESGLAVSTLKNQIHAGRLEAVKKGPDWFVTGKALVNYMESREARGRPAKKRKARRKQAARASAR